MPWGLYHPTDPTLGPVSPSVLYLLGTLLLFIHRELCGEYTPGANDNASGVAVLLEVAKA